VRTAFHIGTPARIVNFRPGNRTRRSCRLDGGIQNDSTAGDTAFFEGLSAGSHAVSLWVRGSGTTLTCEIDHGDLTDEVFAEELAT